MRNVLFRYKQVLTQIAPNYSPGPCGYDNGEADCFLTPNVAPYYTTICDRCDVTAHYQGNLTKHA